MRVLIAAYLVVAGAIVRWDMYMGEAISLYRGRIPDVRHDIYWLALVAVAFQSILIVACAIGWNRLVNLACQALRLKNRRPLVMKDILWLIFVIVTTCMFLWVDHLAAVRMHTAT